ncbi:hypothetical protein NDU88_001473 [Pleurodeles waltl]|uniref:Uncharacterized protein n=1 Tax=Pleurodeles waltl TaxID=8319 RepID=A0AAV7MQ05_PLEWA|nr:hypothetical protein NDU88_001473 [Pleurodeles waltl]
MTSDKPSPGPKQSTLDNMYRQMLCGADGEPWGDSWWCTRAPRRYWPPLPNDAKIGIVGSDHEDPIRVTDTFFYTMEEVLRWTDERVVRRPHTPPHLDS